MSRSTHSKSPAVESTRAKTKTESERTADQSVPEDSAAGHGTTAAAMFCSIAPSGASWIQGLVKRSLSTSIESQTSQQITESPCADAAGPTSAGGKGGKVPKETWCRVEGMPRESWLRRRRKHWPDQSRSTIQYLMQCPDVEVPARCDWIVRTDHRDQRRHHFPGRSKTSVLLDYYFTVCLMSTVYAYRCQQQQVRWQVHALNSEISRVVSSLR